MMRLLATYYTRLYTIHTYIYVYACVETFEKIDLFPPH